MTAQGARILQRVLWASIALFLIAAFIGGSMAVGIAAVLCLWFLLIVGGMIADQVLDVVRNPANRHQDR